MAYLARFDPRFMLERVTFHVPREVVALFCAEPTSERVRWDPSIRALGADGALQTGLVLQPWTGVPAMVGAHHTRCPEWTILKEVLDRSWSSRSAARAMAEWEAEVDRKEPRPKEVPPPAPAPKKGRKPKHVRGVFFGPLETLGPEARRFREGFIRHPNEERRGGGAREDTGEDRGPNRH